MIIHKRCYILILLELGGGANAASVAGLIFSAFHLTRNAFSIHSITPAHGAEPVPGFHSLPANIGFVREVRAERG